MGVSDYLASRPIEAELEAIRVAMDIAGETGAKLHIVHVSCPEGLDLVQEGVKQGVNVTAETCPHYLLLNDQDAKEIGAPAKCAPPLRDKRRMEKMWDRLAQGLITTLGSDHSPSPPSMKVSPDFFAVWGGIAGCQHAFLLTLAEIVHGRVPEIPLEKFAAFSAGQVAERFSLPAKGKIALGYDADLAVIDFSSGEKIHGSDLKYRHKLSPYVRRTVDVLLKQTWLRGELVYDRAQTTPSAPRRGRFLRPERH
jgi:allantoinase